MSGEKSASSSNCSLSNGLVIKCGWNVTHKAPAKICFMIQLVDGSMVLESAELFNMWQGHNDAMVC